MRSMEIRVQVLLSRVVAMEWGFPWCGGGSTRCSSKEVWIEKVGDFGSLHPLLSRRKICVTGVV